MPEIKLRERGIYALPDKREFVVCALGNGSGYLLYNPQAWQRYGLADYRTDADGRILSKDQTTCWLVKDLRDTGRTHESLQAISSR
jgi:hypothetical protein